VRALGGGRRSPDARLWMPPSAPPSGGGCYAAFDPDDARAQRARCDRTAVAVVDDGEEKWGRHGMPPCVPWPVQLRHVCSLTGEAYIARSAWREARLAACPRHPRGGCGLVRHGTYPRRTPTGIRIARYYCPTAHETFSLLPDCRASHFPGELAAVESVVETARSVEAAADALRPEITLPSAVRWVRRRLTPVRRALLALVTLLPELFTGDARLAAACLPCPTRARVQPADVDPAAMTDAELYAYYKRTALTEDLRFFLRGRMSDALRRRAEAIGKPTARDLASLRDTWRTERQADDRAAGIPAIGTAEWHRQCASQPSADADLLTGDADGEHRATADALAETGVSS
jgi:hypothetical protein